MGLKIPDQLRRHGKGQGNGSRCIARIAHTRPKPSLPQRRESDIALQKERGHMRGNSDRPLPDLAYRVRLQNTRVLIGEACNEIDLVRQTTHPFKLETARSLSPGLHAEGRIIRIGGQDIILHQIEEVGREHEIINTTQRSDGLVFQTGLDLLARRWYESCPGKCRADLRLERGGVGNIRVQPMADW